VQEKEVVSDGRCKVQKCVLGGIMRAHAFRASPFGRGRGSVVRTFIAELSVGNTMLPPVFTCVSVTLELTR
jgi:hypothetical protein